MQSNYTNRIKDLVEKMDIPSLDRMFFTTRDINVLLDAPKGKLLAATFFNSYQLGRAYSLTEGMYLLRLLVKSSEVIVCELNEFYKTHILLKIIEVTPSFIRAQNLESQNAMVEVFRSMKDLLSGGAVNDSVQKLQRHFKEQGRLIEAFEKVKSTIKGYQESQYAKEPLDEYNLCLYEQRLINEQVTAQLVDLNHWFEKLDLPSS
jgi:hypothetical protein